MSVDHFPMLDIVLPMECYYGECEHTDADCPGESKRVCGVCVTDVNGEAIGAALWPCPYAPTSAHSEPTDSTPD